MFEWGYIAVFFTNKCNINCKHCILNANITNDDVFDTIHNTYNIIDGMTKSGIKLIGISGGEPLLFKEHLKNFCQSFKEAKISSMIATNAFWASTFQEADNTVDEIKNWGVRYLVISFDEYHHEYIPAQNVFNAVKAAIKHKIEYEVHITALNVETVNKYYNLLKDESIFNVCFNAVEIAGRGEHLDIRNRDITDYKIFSCKKVINPVILLNGDVIACCGLLIAPEYKPSIKSPLYLGNIYVDSLYKILDDASKNRCLILLKKYGPDGISEQLLKKSDYPNIKKINYEGCKLCYCMFNNEERAKEIISLLTY